MKRSRRLLSDMALLPRPRSIVDHEAVVEAGRLRGITLVGAAARVLPAARLVQAAGRAAVGREWALTAGMAAEPPRAAVILELNPDAGVCAQGYRLVIGSEGLWLTAADEAGLRYGALTLAQILRLSGGRPPAGRIEDAPDFPVRGVMLDISRDKVPTMETLRALVDRLAEWKLNHLELYMEHTFAYRHHPDVWAQASPMTGGEILELDAYCRERGIELAPNQNCFGHMGRWLKLPAYRDLAMCPDGFDYPWGARSSEPSSLNPEDPRSLDLVRDLLADLLPHFSSRTVNVGCDEVWELGQGRGKEACERRGSGRVYLDFLLKIHALTQAHGRTMHFWGDIIIRHPELVKELPRDVVALEWGYEADHPFAEHGARFAAAGIPFHVCPGTSSWNSIAGRADNCLKNLRNAAENGLRHGASGYRVTDWGDNGHWQYQPVSYLGFMAGAGFSWNARGHRDSDWAGLLDRHAFMDEAGAMGALALALGNVYRLSGSLKANTTSLFKLLNDPTGTPAPAGLTRRTLARAGAAIEAVADGLAGVRLRTPDGAVVGDEFRNAARMLRHACRRGLMLMDGKAPDRRWLAADLRDILGEHRRLWLARNRPGGLQDSVRALERALGEYER
jgi:hypothetical protein